MRPPLIPTRRWMIQAGSAIPTCSKASRQASTCWYTLAISVPSKSKRNATVDFISIDALQRMFDAPVRYQPDCRHQDIEPAGKARGYKSHRNRHRVDDHRYLAFEVTAQGFGDRGLLPVNGYEGMRQNVVGTGGCEQDHPV